MKQKKHHIEPEDKLLGDFFNDYDLDQPGNNLVKNTMSEVLHEWSQKPLGQTPPVKLSHKIWIALGVVCSLLLVYQIDLKNTSGTRTISETFNLTNNGQVFTQAFDSIFNSFSYVPDLVYMIILGVGLVFLLDKFLSSHFKTLQE